jgi:para-aminobenzoate synthetase component 1
MDRLGGSGIPFVFVVDYEGRTPLVVPYADLEASGISIRFEGMPLPGNSWPVRDNLSPDRIKRRYVPEPVPFDLYRERFNRVREHLIRGDSYLVNLTFPTRLVTDMPLGELWNRLSAPYCLMVPGLFACFSPERFVRFEGNRVTTSPMKGTIDASTENAERRLMDDPKEQAEHVTVVDLLRNDLSAIASDVGVTRYRWCSPFEAGGRRLLQTSTDVTGQLPGNWREQLGELFFTLLPAGSVTGAPKKRTMEIIDRAEIDRRGHYTGVFGVFDGKTLDSAVIIRYIGADGPVWRSGGGITLDSDAEKEYQEMLEKVYVPVS